MKYSAAFILLVLCTYAPLANSVIAQSSDIEAGQQVVITTKDGNSYRGKLISMDGEVVELETPNLGVIRINKEDIEQLKDLSQDKYAYDKNGYPIDYHGSTHYLANSTGYNLKKGQSYYQNIGICFNSYSVGVSDHFSVTVGGEIASLLFGGRVPILFVAPKYSLPLQSEKLAISLGATFFTSPQDNFVGFGILQSAVTFGDRNNNFTLGGGIGFNTADGFSSTVIPFYPSFMFRIGEKLSFVSDNFVLGTNNFDEVNGIVTAALRVHFRKVGSSLDVGLFRPTIDAGSLIGLPWVSATIALK